MADHHSGANRCSVFFLIFPRQICYVKDREIRQMFTDVWPTILTPFLIKLSSSNKIFIRINEFISMFKQTSFS